MSWDTTEFFAWSLIFIGYFLAVVGTIVPGLPGALMIVIAVWAHEYFRPETYSWISHALLIILALLSWALDFLAGIWGARLGGATKAGLIGAMIGGLVGIPFGFIGLILGPFFGAIAGDLYGRRRDVMQLLRSGGGAALGFVLSLLGRFGLLLAMAVVLLFGAVF